jgi:hypothetical protein
MESFVIRIYRRAEAGQPTVVGTLEAIATGERTAFHSPAELLALVEGDILCPKSGAGAARGEETNAGSPK